MSAGNTEKAARQFMQAADINPSGYEAPGFLGQAYLAIGRPEAARQALETAMANIKRHLQMNPDDSWALGSGAVNLAPPGERTHRPKGRPEVKELCITWRFRCSQNH